MNLRELTNEFILDCEYRALSPKTIDNYRWAIAKLHAHFTEVPDTGRQLRPVIADPNLGIEGRRTLMRMLNRVFNWSVKNHYMVANPLEELDPLPKSGVLPYVLEDAEIQWLFDQCESRRDAALVAIILDTGLRLGEVANLRWHDVHQGHLRVTGKRGQRRVPITQKGLGYLVGLGDGHHIWIGHQGPIARAGIYQIFRRLFLRARIPSAKKGPHTLRHTFATLYVRDGGKVRVLQEILGHTRLETTMIYVHLAGIDIDEDHALHSPLVNLNLTNKYLKEEVL